MINLLNAVSFFGKELDVSANTIILWLLIIQSVLIILAIVVLGILIWRTRGKKEQVEEDEPVADDIAATETDTDSLGLIVAGTIKEEVRELLYISLNTDSVQKEFTVGDSLNHDGLIVTATFNTEPLTEEITDYTVLSPDMDKEGNPTVTVAYQDRVVGYQITITHAPETETPVAETITPVAETDTTVPETDTTVPEMETPVSQPEITVSQLEIHEIEPIVIAEESVEAGILRYNKSFTARFIQSDDEIKQWYTEIKNEMLSYKKAKSRISWKRETFKVGKDVFAKLSYRGKTLCLFLPLNIADYVDSSFPLEDVSNTPSNEDTPVMLRLKSNRRIKIAKKLIVQIMEQRGIVRIERISEDYYLPYEGIVELINKGLIKRKIKTVASETIFNQNKGVQE